MLHSSSLTKIARIEPICAPITLKEPQPRVIMLSMTNRRTASTLYLCKDYTSHHFTHHQALREKDPVLPQLDSRASIICLLMVEGRTIPFP